MSGLENRTLGVLGGMGPLASAEFVRSVYKFARVRREQEMPRVLLDSDPAFPDRTEAILTGRGEEISALLDARLRRLVESGSTHTVVTCVTAHHFLRQTDPLWQNTLESLTDRVVDQVVSSSGRFLMLCSLGTRRARVFQNTPGWPKIAYQVTLPTRRDQEQVHQLIYQMKVQGAAPDLLASVDLMRAQYGCSGVILGCTEFHLISQDLVDAYGEDNVVDPLRSVAMAVSGSTAATLARSGTAPDSR